MAALTAVVVLPAWVGLVSPASAASSGAPPTESAVPRISGLPAGWTQTWSTGPLPDAGQPIAMSSPVVANLSGQPSALVGDRRGFVYAYHLADGTPAAGWPTTDGSGPIDSTPSVATLRNGSISVAIGSGNDADPKTGGYQAFSPSGSRQWFTSVINPASDGSSSAGVQAGLTVGGLQPGEPGLVAGSLGQVSYALNAATGAVSTGWPFFNSDSTHSTAALADLYGTGQSEVIVGGDQTAGQGRGQTYTNGGHLRILTGRGNQVCRADTNQVVDSSPAVGAILPGHATGIVVGTGGFFANASDSNTVKAYDTRCRLKWSAKLDGSTQSSPALSDVRGDGSLQVVEGTDQGPDKSGSVWVLNASTGQTIWKASGIGRIIGSAVTADLSGAGYDDVIVPTLTGTTPGTMVFDGRSGQQIAELSPFLGLQNSPLVTRDPNGTIGITLAGYVPSGGPGSPAVGQIDHYEIAGSNGSEAISGSAWPMFHHDPQLTGTVGATTPRGSIPPCSIPAAVNAGYDLVAADGGIFSYPTGAMPFCGSTGRLHLNAPIVGMALAPVSGGYWEVAADGGIFAFGDAGFAGSMGGKHLNRPIVAMAATPDGRGYWEVAADGGIFAFGDATFFGSMGGTPLNRPVVGISSSADGRGYRLVASDGGIFSFGDAPFSGSVGGRALNAPVVGTATDADTGGYWEVASDGGIFAFGGTRFLGSTGGSRLNAPVVGIAETFNGAGYRLAASDGGIFAFGGAPFFGSAGGLRLNAPMVGMAGF